MTETVSGATTLEPSPKLHLPLLPCRPERELLFLPNSSSFRRKHPVPTTSIFLSLSRISNSFLRKLHAPPPHPLSLSHLASGGSFSIPSLSLDSLAGQIPGSLSSRVAGELPISLPFPSHFPPDHSLSRITRRTDSEGCLLSRRRPSPGFPPVSLPHTHSLSNCVAGQIPGALSSCLAGESSSLAGILSRRGLRSFPSLTLTLSPLASPDSPNPVSSPVAGRSFSVAGIFSGSLCLSPAATPNLLRLFSPAGRSDNVTALLTRLACAGSLRLV